MSTAAAPSYSPTASATPAGSATTTVARGWLLGPAQDLLFIANVCWPLLALFAATLSQTATYKAFGFVLAYFVIMPHRWLTLPLVFCDRQRLAERRWAYLVVLSFVVLLCSTIQITMPTLALLVAIDYLWNAWHFAAQHAGIARIYGRMSQTANPAGASPSDWMQSSFVRDGSAEKLLLRTFCLYTLLRLTGQFVPEKSFPWLEWVRDVMPNLAMCDLAMLALPAGFLACESWFGLNSKATLHSRLGRLAYLTSICSVYAALLLGIHYQIAGLTFGCAIAVTWIHSTEYMAIVTWSVPKNRSLTAGALFARLVPRWTVSLLAFMAFFAVTTWVLQRSFVDGRWFGFWAWLNLTVSLLHYAYDGMIWKKPKPQSVKP